MLSGARRATCLLVGALIALQSAPAASQSSDDGDAAEQPLVAEVRYNGNTFFSDYDLFLRTRVRANREFLGIDGLRWWLWIYRLGESGKLGNRLGRALTASGEAPAVFDPALVQSDTDRLSQFYSQEGFRAVEVTTDTTHLSDEWIRVSYNISEGPPTYLRNISFEGLGRLSLAQRAELVSASSIRHTSSSATADSLIAEDQRYSEPLLLEERRRILTYLHNNGFASASRDSIRALVIPARPDSFDIRLQINTGRQFNFGNVSFVVTGPETEPRPRAAVLRADSTGRIDATFSSESKLSPRLLNRALQFEPGGQFDQAEVLATKRRLEATGTFAFTNVTALRGSRTTAGTPRIDFLYELRTLERHSLGSEWFMLQRGGALGGADAELGMGVGVTYRNANLLGSGEAFNIRTSGSIAADSDFKLFTSTQGEISFSIAYPYLIAPFRWLEGVSNFYNVGTRLSLSLLTARRDQLKLIVRGRGDARMRLEMQHAPTRWSFVDIVDISLSNPDTLSGFGTDFLDPLLASIEDDPVQRAQIIEDYTQPQVNDAFRYTYRSARVNPLRRDQGYSYEAAAEIGGVGALGLDRIVFSPDELEGSLPGLPIFGRDAQSQRLVYRPYVRVLADLRQYRRLSPNAVLAWKAIGGIAHPISMNEVVPFDRRFFAGGAFSVRGWRLGELGPGDATIGADAAATETTNILGGDVKLEGSVEYRHTVFRRFLGAEWILAPFVDAGNVWFGPRNPGLVPAEEDGPDGKFDVRSLYREIGVGSGAGIRISWEYLIVRFDLAYQVYDPARRDVGLLPDGLRRPLPHFGIGHTF